LCASVGTIKSVLRTKSSGRKKKTYCHLLVSEKQSSPANFHMKQRPQRTLKLY